MRITDIEAIHTRVEDSSIALFDESDDDCIIRVRTDKGMTGNHWAPELLELSTSRSLLRRETTCEQIEANKDGMVAVPDGTGLSVTLDEATVARCRVPASASNVEPMMAWT